MLLYKIIPDEFPLFKTLRITPVREYLPAWRQQLESQMESQMEASVPKPEPNPTAWQMYAPAAEKPTPSREPTYSYTLDQPKQASPSTPTGGLGMVEKTLTDVLGDDEAE